MVSLLEELSYELPDFPPELDEEQFRQFIFSVMEDIAERINTAAQDSETGVTGSFTTTDGKTVSVTGGIITGIV